VYWPTLVPATEVAHRVTLPDGTCRMIPHPPTGAPAVAPRPVARVTRHFGPTRRLPLGTVAGARSGDKGGNANIGLWTHTDAEYAWLSAYLDEERLRALLPEAAGLEVRRYELPNLRALNFVVAGILGDGVASATRPDPQAKGLGEYLRSCLVDVPETIIRPSRRQQAIQTATLGAPAVTAVNESAVERVPPPHRVFGEGFQQQVAQIGTVDLGSLERGVVGRVLLQQQGAVRLQKAQVLITARVPGARSSVGGWMGMVTSCCSSSMKSA
jgi:hypothetical protein